MYISPCQQISKKASEITGLKYFDSRCMYSSGKEIESVYIRLGLPKLIQYKLARKLFSKKIIGNCKQKILIQVLLGKS